MCKLQLVNTEEFKNESVLEDFKKSVEYHRQTVGDLAYQNPSLYTEYDKLGLNVVEALNYLYETTYGIGNTASTSGFFVKNY